MITEFNDVLRAFSAEDGIKSYKNTESLGFWAAEKILIDKYFIRGRVLDIGCGTGRTTKQLNKQYSVIGIDACDAMVSAANVDYIKKGDARNMEFNDNEFSNALFSFNGLAHIPKNSQRLRALKEISRVLQPNGIFILVIPIKKNKQIVFWAWQRVLHCLRINSHIEYGDISYTRIDRFQHTIKQFVHVFDKNEIEGELQVAEFKIIYAAYRNEIAKDEIMPYANSYFIVCKNGKAI